MIDEASTWVRRRQFSAAAALSVGLLALFGCLGGSGCDDRSSGPRALVVVDGGGGSSSGQATWLTEKAAAFEKSHKRAVRVLHVDSVDAAVELAARGEADVAVVPAALEGGSNERLERFFASEHGRAIGAASVGGARVQVIAVNPKQHPKVDEAGALLAGFLVDK